MGIFRNANESGAGIAKKTDSNHGFMEFWKIFGRKFWNLFSLNILYMLFYIPLLLSLVFYRVGGSLINYIVSGIFMIVFCFLLGPATGGMFKVLRAYSLEQPIFMAHTFFKGFRREYKKNLFWGIVDMVTILSVYSSFRIYPKYFNDSVLKYLFLSVIVFVALTVLMMNFYYFLLSVSTDLSFKNTVKDSFCLVTIALKKNIITLLISVLIFAVVFLLLSIAQLWILFLFLPAAIIGFIISYNCYPYIQKYVINPYYREKGEINPEIEYEYAKDKIFEDMGGKEKPVRIERKNKRVKGRGGKDIS